MRSNREALAAAAPTDAGYPALIATEKANAAKLIEQMSAVKTQIYAVLTPAQIKQIPQILAADKAKWHERQQNPASGRHGLDFRYILVEAAPAVRPPSQSSDAFAAARGPLYSMITAVPYASTSVTPAATSVGVIAHADDGVRAALGGVLQHQRKGVTARFLAKLGEERDVAAEQSLQRGADRTDETARAHDNAAHHSDVPDDAVARAAQSRS